MPPPRRQRSRIGRLFGGPAVILVVAGVIAYFVWQREKTTTAEVHDFVETMCRQASLGESLAWSLSQTDPAVAREVTTALESLLGGGAVRRTDWWVDVVAADHSELGDGTATHTAIIVIMEQPMLGLRLLHRPASESNPNLPSTDEIMVLGYWVEGP